VRQLGNDRPAGAPCHSHAPWSHEPPRSRQLFDEVARLACLLLPGDYTQVLQARVLAGRPRGRGRGAGKMRVITSYFGLPIERRVIF
jgi:hypothetical protein